MFYYKPGLWSTELYLLDSRSIKPTGRALLVIVYFLEFLCGYSEFILIIECSNSVKPIFQQNVNPYSRGPSSWFRPPTQPSQVGNTNMLVSKKPRGPNANLNSPNANPNICVDSHRERQHKVIEFSLRLTI